MFVWGAAQESKTCPRSWTDLHYQKEVFVKRKGKIQDYILYMWATFLYSILTHDYSMSTQLSFKNSLKNNIKSNLGFSWFFNSIFPLNFQNLFSRYLGASGYYLMIRAGFRNYRQCCFTEFKKRGYILFNFKMSKSIWTTGWIQAGRSSKPTL